MRATRHSSVLLTRAVALLLLVSMAECAAEQRIESRGSNRPSIVEKGSCLSYGHSCWGAHGKRSGKARDGTEEARSTAHLSDWYLAKLLRRMSGANPFDTRKLVPLENLSEGDLNAIYRTRIDNEDIAKLFESEEGGAGAAEETLASRRDDAGVGRQVKAKLLQIMKEASDDK